MKADLTEGELRAHKAILGAMQAIQEIDGDQLVYNREELCESVHVLQHFVTQHYVHRICPEYYGSWYGEDERSS